MVIFWQRLEGLIVFFCALAVFAYYNESLAWWAAILIFFSPDLSFFGYLANKSVGAHLYNFMHLYALGAAIAATGLILGNEVTMMIGTLLVAHCGFDRAVGYGLKHRSSFHHTHLGTIGKAPKA